MNAKHALGDNAAMSLDIKSARWMSRREKSGRKCQKENEMLRHVNTLS